MLDSSFVPHHADLAAEADAFRRLAAAAPPERQELEHELVLAHMRFAEGIARRFSGSFSDSSDIRQVALVGLVKAVKRFDPERGFPFSAFARATISGEIKRYLRDHSWAVRPPRAVQEMAMAVTSATPVLEQTLQHHPSRAEMAEHLSVDVSKVAEGSRGGKAMFASSLDDPSVASSVAASVADAADAIEWRADLREAMRSLSERDQTIVYLRYFKGCTQNEIAREIGTSQVQVSRALTKLLATMRTQLGEPYAS